MSLYDFFHFFLNPQKINEYEINNKIDPDIYNTFDKLKIISIHSIVLLVGLISMITIFIIKLIKSIRNNTLFEYLDTFKKGKCFILYSVIIPIYLLGIIFSDKSFNFYTIIKAIGNSVFVIALKFDTSSISELINLCPVYNWTVHLCFFMSVANAGIVLYVLTWKYLREYFSNKEFKNGINKCYIIGNNDNNYEIYKSCKNDKRYIPVICDDLSKDDRKKLFEKGFRYINNVDYVNKNKESYSNQYNYIIEVIKKYLKNIEKYDKKQGFISIILNSEDDEKNLKCCAEISNTISTYIDERNRVFNCSSKLINFIIKYKIENYNNDNIVLCNDLINLILNYMKDNELHYFDLLKIINNYFIDKRIDNHYLKMELNDKINYEIENIKQTIVDLSRKISVYVFGDINYEEVYLYEVKNSYGIIKYRNPFEEIGFEFQKNYPLTRFIEKEHLNDDELTIKDTVYLNITFVGFGKTNQQVFLSSVANNQFLEKKNDNTIEKPVNYHIIDKVSSKDNKLFNHNYYRYKNEIFNNDKIDKNDYLELPKLPAKENFYPIDINSHEFNKKLKEIIDKNNENSINYVIVSFGSDLENLDVAEHIFIKKKEWNIKNLYIFVKLNTTKYDSTIINNKDVFSFGNEVKEVYNINQIISSELYELGKKRNQEYEKNLEEYKDKNDPMIKLNAEYKWLYLRTEIERDSNIYSVLFLYSLFKLLRIEINKDDNGKNIISGKFKRRYEEFIYKNEKLLDDLEHYRWNAFLITSGMVPMCIDEIKKLKLDCKNYPLRKHGYITTTDGLKQFEKVTGCKSPYTNMQLFSNAIEFLEKE